MSNGASDGWTRAAMVVGGVARRDDAILLVHEHTLGREGPDQWVLPEGRLEPGVSCLMPRSSGRSRKRLGCR